MGLNLEVVYNPNNTQAIAALKGTAQSIASQIGTRQVVNNAVIGLLLEKDMTAPGSVGDLAQAIRAQLAGQTKHHSRAPLISFTYSRNWRC